VHLFYVRLRGTRLSGEVEHCRFLADRMITHTEKGIIEFYKNSEMQPVGTVSKQEIVYITREEVK
jgi:hypothetical protein